LLLDSFALISEQVSNCGKILIMKSKKLNRILLKKATNFSNQKYTI